MQNYNYYSKVKSVITTSHKKLYSDPFFKESIIVQLFEIVYVLLCHLIIDIKSISRDIQLSNTITYHTLKMYILSQVL